MNGCKQCLQNVCRLENIHSKYNTINTVNTNVPESIILWNNSNIVNTINTIYTEFASTCGSGKKYKNCCGREV